MKKWSKRTRWTAGILVAVLVVAAALAVWRFSTRGSSPASAASAPTQTVKVLSTTLKQTVSATGSLAPQKQSYLNFPTVGTVETLRVSVGQQVKAGDLLATQDTTTLDAAVSSAQAAVDSAYSTLSSLNDSSSATSTQISAANAQAKSAEAKLAQTKSDLAGATMTSPIAGVVAQVNLAVGSKSAGGASVSTGISGTSSTNVTSQATASASTAQIVVVDTSSWQLNATVGMTDLAALKQGMVATVTPTGAQPHPAHLTSIGLIGTTSGGQSTYPVIVTLDGNPTGLYIGGTADAVITINEITALVVPTNAVTNDNGQTVVKVMKNGVTSTVPVKLGRTFGPETEVTSGVAAGDEVEVPNAPAGVRSGFPQGQRTPGAQRSFGQNPNQSPAPTATGSAR